MFSVSGVLIMNKLNTCTHSIAYYWIYRKYAGREMIQYADVFMTYTYPRIRFPLKST